MSFKKFLAEGSTGSSGSSGSSGSLHVFDIDETLMHTNAEIIVKDKTGNILQKLTSSEFNNHKLEQGNEYDFTEFRDSLKFNTESKPIMQMIEQLNRIHNKIKLNLTPNSKIIMNTAREDFNDKHLFLNTFKKYGIDIDDIYVYRAGNLPGNDIPAKKKLVHIRKDIEIGNYSDVHMYDDSRTNLSYFKSLESEYPNIKFHAWIIDHKGNMRKF